MLPNNKNKSHLKLNKTIVYVRILKGIEKSGSGIFVKTLFVNICLIGLLPI